MRKASILLLVAAVLCAAGYAAGAQSADPTIYVDPAGINARTDLTDAQKAEVKKAMEDTIKENLEQAFGPGNVTITDDPKKADRTVKTENTIGEEKDKDNKKSYFWGDWEHGSSSTRVCVGTYMDVDWIKPTFQKPDGSWDTQKLGKAMGTTGAHEVAHSYSAGHDNTNTNKMNTANKPGEIAGGLNFNDGPKKTLQDNNGKPPCQTTTNYKSTCCLANWWSDPLFPLDSLLHEPFSITTSFDFNGHVSSFFDIGWWGVDTDNGLLDGNPWGDFVYKSSMTGTLQDMPTITFFDGWTAHFVIRGRTGTPYAGRYFNILPADIVLSNWVTRPDGLMVAKHIHLSWDVDGFPGPDVIADMDTNAFGPGSPPFSGFTLGIAPPISIAEAKQRVDGFSVALSGDVVTATFPGYFYLEAPSRNAGIRVNWPGEVGLNSAVMLFGKMSTNANGERQIDAAQVLAMAPRMIRPVAMPHRSVGGSDFHYIGNKWPSGQMGVMGGVGLNNIGLYILVFGRVLAPGPDWFIIEDGSHVFLKVACEPGSMTPLPGMYVSVAGISSCEMMMGAERPMPLVRAVEWQWIPEIGPMLR